MKAIISSTYLDTYLFFIPIVTFCWNKLNVEVICFMPDINKMDYDEEGLSARRKLSLITSLVRNNTIKLRHEYFDAPKNKEATYAQVSRLYAACLDLPEDEVLCTGDVDMIVFNSFKSNVDLSIKKWGDMMTVFGSDLVPEKQTPICYVWGSVKEWRRCYKHIYGDEIKNYQQRLDELLGHIEAEHFKGNFWSKDQEVMKQLLSKTAVIEIPRSNGKNQFAKFRYDRDDSFLLERLNLDTIDFHLLRPGYEEKNFDIIMQVLKFHFPNDNLQWIVDYKNKYIELL